MPHHAAFSPARLYGPVDAVKGSLRRAAPALDRVRGTLTHYPEPTQISKEANFIRLDYRVLIKLLSCTGQDLASLSVI